MRYIFKSTPSLEICIYIIVCTLKKHYFLCIERSQNYFEINFKASYMISLGHLYFLGTVPDPDILTF